METYIHEDRGENNENVITWHNIDGSMRRMALWMIIPQQPMGCQYVNVYNSTISELFGCNTNVQVGDPIHMFYITLYNLNSTQKEEVNGVETSQSLSLDGLVDYRKKSAPVDEKN